MRHLILNLEAPLMAFGGETIDNYSVVRRFPAASMLTGMFANALGWRRIERESHQRLQDRLVFAARIDREPHGGLHMRDFQTAAINKNDEGWTTRGFPETRAGGPNTYNSPTLRYRDYFADMRVTVVLRLQPADAAPTLNELAQVLDSPARPLFIGRKPCLPSAPLLASEEARRFADGGTALEALLATPLCDMAAQRISLMYPDGEGADGVEPNRTFMLTDERNWISGLHGGGRWVCEASVGADRFRAPDAAIASA